MKMPPQQPNDPTRRVIDIAFAMPEGTLRAMEQLTQQMAAAQASVEAMLSATPEGRATGARSMARRVTPGSVPAGSQGFASVPPDALNALSSGFRGYAGMENAHGQLPSTPPEPQPDPVQQVSHLPLRQRIGAYRAQGRKGLTSILDAEIARYGAREEEQAQRRSGYNPTRLRNFEEPAAGTHAGSLLDDDLATSNPGRPSSGASTPPTNAGEPSGMNPALRALYANTGQFERAQEGFRMPQFGELTVQDKLRMASDFLTRSSFNAYQRGQAQGLPPDQLQNVAVNRGRSAVLLNMAADQATQAMVVGKNVRSVFNWGQGMQDQGIEAGYDPGGTVNIPGTNIGFRNPLDFLRGGSAFRESMNQRVNVQRLRLEGGISGKQASEIVGSLSSLGWTGEQGQTMAFDALRPLVQQGLNPSVTSQMFDQAIRNGNTSLIDLRETLDNLGPSARAAHMSLTEYQEGLDQFANQLQGQGATYGEGVRTGRALSNAYGMSPQQMGAFTQSPLVQAFGAVQYGALPQEFGALGTAGIASATGGAVDQALRAFSGFKDNPIRNAQGKIITPGNKRQLIMAAQALGVPMETLQRYQQGRKLAPHILQGTANLDRIDRANALIKGATERNVSQNDWLAPGARPIGDAGDPRVEQHADNTPERQAAIRESDRLFSGHGGVVDQMVLTARQETDRTKRGELFKQINSIKDEDDPVKRSKKAREFLSGAAQRVVEERTDNKTQVEFTGAAAKYFQQVEGKLPKEFRDANAGGKPRSDAALADSSNNYIDLLRAQYPG